MLANNQIRRCCSKGFCSSALLSYAAKLAYMLSPITGDVQLAGVSGRLALRDNFSSSCHVRSSLNLHCSWRFVIWLPRTRMIPRRACLYIYKSLVTKDSKHISTWRVDVLTRKYLCQEPLTPSHAYHRFQNSSSWRWKFGTYQKDGSTYHAEFLRSE